MNQEPGRVTGNNNQTKPNAKAVRIPVQLVQ